MFGSHGAGRQQQQPCGTTIGRHAQAARGPAEKDGPPPRMVHCANCESQFVLLSGQDLPPRWKLIGGEPLCADCAPPARAALRAATGRMPRPQPATALKSVGGIPGRTKHHGCRIGHEIALGFAALQIRAGKAAPEGRDEAVQFMLDARGLDDVIIELSVIRAELVASRTPGAAKGKGSLS